MSTQRRPLTPGWPLRLSRAAHQGDVVSRKRERRQALVTNIHYHLSREMIGEGFDIDSLIFLFPSSYAEIRIDRDTDSTSRFNEGSTKVKTNKR